MNVNKDVLQTIFDSQKSFQAIFGTNFETLEDKDRSEYINEHASFLVEETYEMLREMKYRKSWKDYSSWTPEKDDEQLIKMKEEWIDMFHFIVNIGLALDFDANEVLKMYIDKNKLNYERQENASLGYVLETR